MQPELAHQVQEATALSNRRPQTGRAPSVLFFLPGAILTLRAIRNVQLLPWDTILKLIPFATLILVGIIVASNAQLRARRWPILVIMFV
jgi:hypothetical protein